MITNDEVAAALADAVATKKLVLLFSTRADPANAARLHSASCTMVNTIGSRARLVAGNLLIGGPVRGTIGTEEELAEDVADLNEREYPVKKCRCCAR